MRVFQEGDLTSLIEVFLPDVGIISGSSPFLVVSILSLMAGDRF